MTQPRTHPLEWAALACCIAALSHTEWSLAVAAGAHPVVAAAVPGALDIYAIRAMRTRRHVPAVVCSMVGVNALSYLVHAGVVPMKWPVLVIVSAIVPLVFWAVHELGHGEHVPDLAERRKRVLWDVPMDAELEEHVPQDTLDRHVDTLPVPVDEWGTDVHGPAALEHARRAVNVKLPDVPVLPVHPFPEDTPERDTPGTVLPLPDGFQRETRQARARRTLEEHVEEARTLYGDRVPGVREVKEDTGCGTERAQQVIEALKKGHES